MLLPIMYNFVVSQSNWLSRFGILDTGLNFSSLKQALDVIVYKVRLLKSCES